MRHGVGVARQLNFCGDFGSPDLARAASLALETMSAQEARTHGWYEGMQYVVVARRLL
jgi:hypothetical protein